MSRAIQEVTGRAPQGQGDQGECNYRNFGGGQWSSYPDLVAKVRVYFAAAAPKPAPPAATAGQCRDAWVTRAVRQVTGRAANGSGDEGECNYRNYGGGQWSSYEDLVAKVRARLAPPAPPAAPPAATPPAPPRYSEAFPPTSERGYARRLYQIVLGREPEAGAAEGREAQLRGGASRLQVALEFYGSPEYANRRESDPDFVRGLYRLALCRDAEPSGIEHHVNLLRAGLTRPQMVEALFSNDEARGKWASCIGGPLPAGGGNATKPAAGATVYRWYRPGSEWHLFTTNPQERPGGWNEERERWAMLADGTPGTRPLYRLQRSDGGHFYTAEPAELAAVKGQGWQVEGTLGNIATGRLPGTVELHRFLKGNSRHFYTLDRAEGDRAGFRHEGVIGFVLPVAMTPGQAPAPSAPAAIAAHQPGESWDDSSNFDGSAPDFGIYWFRSATDGKRSTGPSQNDAYYNPNRPTMIYVHGWQKDIFDASAKGPNQPIEKRRESFDVNPTGKETEGTDVISGWVRAGWNVGIFYWDKFADEDEGFQHPYGLRPLKAEAKIWTPNGEARMRWRKPDGKFAEYKQDKSAMDLFYEAYVEAMGSNPGTKEIRLVGHSLGNQMVVRMTKWLSDQVTAGKVSAPLPHRIALLDPYWSGGEKKYLNGAWNGAVVRQFVGELRQRHDIVFEQYQTSALNHAPGNDANDALRAHTVYARLHPLWVGEAVGPLDRPKAAHVAAIHWYFKSFDTGLAVCSRDLVEVKFIPDARAPSAAMPTDKLKALVGSTNLNYEQKWGENTSKTDDDCVIP